MCGNIPADQLNTVSLRMSVLLARAWVAMASARLYRGGGRTCQGIFVSFCMRLCKYSYGFGVDGLLLRTDGCIFADWVG